MHSKTSKSHIWRHFYGIIKIQSQKIHHQNDVTKIFHFQALPSTKSWLRSWAIPLKLFQYRIMWVAVRKSQRNLLRVSPPCCINCLFVESSHNKYSIMRGLYYSYVICGLVLTSSRFVPKLQISDSFNKCFLHFRFCSAYDITNQ